ncbi:hypothetical protein BH10PSE12_BH10PSE12_05150 [soil metagenome]
MAGCVTLNNDVLNIPFTTSAPPGICKTMLNPTWTKLLCIAMRLLNLPGFMVNAFAVDAHLMPVLNPDMGGAHGHSHRGARALEFRERNVQRRAA